MAILMPFQPPRSPKFVLGQCVSLRTSPPSVDDTLLTPPTEVRTGLFRKGGEGKGRKEKRNERKGNNGVLCHRLGSPEADGETSLQCKMFTWNHYLWNERENKIGKRMLLNWDADPINP